MLLTEKIEDINKWLKRDFGCFPDDTPNWRVVLAGEQIEKRVMTYTDSGMQLLFPEVREVKKYQHIDPAKYVLERQVPVMGETDLITKTSYEPAWTFEDRFGNYLPPVYMACKFVIDRIYSQQDKAGFMKKYNDPAADPEYREQRVKDMEFKLFGNETPVGDALAHGYGITVPENFSKEKKEVNNG